MDWIESFMLATANTNSPERFRLWSAISAISGALERRVWTEGTGGPIFPHLYNVLVGAPASGKTTSIRIVRDLWSRIPGFHVAADNLTREALVDAMAKSLRTIVNGAEFPLIYSALNVACSEFGVFFANHDTHYLSFINHIYDGLNSYKEERRTVDPPEVIKPHLVILAGTQPDFLGSFMPEEAWGMGFTSRLLLIYSAAPGTTKIFGKSVDVSKGLQGGINDLAVLKGEFVWMDDAIDEFVAWDKSGPGGIGGAPIPQHPRLRHYLGRRPLNVIKLSMISSASRGVSMTVTIDDVERAKSWLLEAEAGMPDIFLSMAQKSDSQIIDDMHLALYRMYSSVVRGERKPIQKEAVYRYLAKRIPSPLIPKIIETAEHMGVLKPGTYPDEWIPAPLNEHTPEAAL